MFKSNFFLAALAAVWLLTSCGNARPSANIHSSPSPTVNPHGVSLGEGQDLDELLTEETFEENAWQKSPKPTIAKKADGTYDVPNFVEVEVPEWISWEGETCAPPRRGSSCRVPFYGKVWSNENEATILFQAFENGSLEPAAELPLDASKGLTAIDHWFPYRISRDTEFVMFRAVLRSKSGLMLAENKPYYAPIGR